MKLEKLKVRTEKLYHIGYNSFMQKYVLTIVVPWIIWYHRYYEISESEYMLYKNNIAGLDNLAQECTKAETSSSRFLYSDDPRENNAEQDKLRQEVRNHDDTNGRITDFERI